MKPEIEELLRFCPRLPTLSGVALRIVKMAREPEIDIDQLAALISKDPALTVKIIRAANSPLLGRAQRTRNLQQAVMLLGLNSTITLSLSFSLTNSLKRNESQRQGLEHFWRRCLLSALACRELGRQCKAGALEELFLAGLLHEIGVLVLASVFPERYPALLDASSNHEGLIAQEREHLATDHGEAGAWIMREWGLPDYIPLATAAIHNPQAMDTPESLHAFIACVGLSGYIADIYLETDTESATASAASANECGPALDRAVLSTVLLQVANSLPEIEELFEMSFMSCEQVNGITDEARELLVMRYLQLLQHASEADRKASELERTAVQLQEMARRDPLTGAYNRRYFDEMLSQRFEAATRHQQPLSLGFLDLDHFKMVNDRYGHQAGDVVLAGVAKAISSRLRGDDFLARYGGEEFVLLLPNTNLELAQRILERIRAHIETEEHTVAPEHMIRITLSAGAAAHMDGSRISNKLDDLIRAADRALYLAKRQGRNRVEVAE
ncbi:GGDEF domain-containing protein [Nitrococcus mobilis]|nr:GGDEF domain-containing protein [Nitrococcus mobilis]